MSPHTQRRRHARRGTTVVEFALVAPLLFTVVFGCLEIGRAQMVLHCMSGAALEGCRTAVVNGATTSEVNGTVANMLSSAGIGIHTVAISPSNLNSVDQWDPVTVTVTVQYNNVSLLPVPSFLKNKTLTRSSTLPREAEPVTATP